MIKKAFKKLGVKGKYLNIIKAIYDNPTVNIIFDNEQLKGFPLRSVARQGSHSYHF